LLKAQGKSKGQQKAKSKNKNPQIQIAIADPGAISKPRSSSLINMAVN
jgi:hypothetical protein